MQHRDVIVARGYIVAHGRTVRCNVCHARAGQHWGWYVIIPRAEDVPNISEYEMHLIALEQRMRHLHLIDVLLRNSIVFVPRLADTSQPIGKRIQEIVDLSIYQPHDRNPDQSFYPQPTNPTPHATNKPPTPAAYNRTRGDASETNHEFSFQ